MLRPFAHLVACCCVLLEVVAQSLKPVKRSTTCKRAQQVPNLSGQQFWELLRPFARGLSNGDGDVNENGKTAIGVDWQNNNFARASGFFVHFFAVTARPFTFYFLVAAASSHYLRYIVIRQKQNFLSAN